MAYVNTRSFRATCKLVVASLLISTCAPAVEAAGLKIRAAAMAAATQVTWQPYADATDSRVLTQDQIRAQVSPDAATWHAEAVSGRDDAVSKLNNPSWVRPEIEPLSGSDMSLADPGDNSVWSTSATPTSAGNHMVAPAGETGTASSGGGTADGSSQALGEALSWQDSFPAGGTLLSRATVNSLNGNRTAAVPIVSWSAKGGIPIDLTLYHNSGGSVGYMWGRGWRSSLDIDVVQGYPQSNPRRASVVFGDGSTIPFVAVANEPTTGGTHGAMRYSPPVGYYDVLTRFGSSSAAAGWHLRRRDGSVLTFNSFGRLASIRDSRNNVVTIGRSTGNSPMTSVTDSAGRQLTFTTALGENSIHPAYTSVTDPSGRKWEFRVAVPAPEGHMQGTRYDKVGDLLSLTLPKVGGPNAVEAETKLQWSYNQVGDPQILWEKDPMGSVWLYTYDSSTGSLKTVKDPLLKTTTYATGSVATMTTPRGAVWTHTYQGDLIAAVQDPAGYTESYHYDARGNRDQVTDRRGKVWRSTYDAYGNMIASQSPEQYKVGKSETFSYNASNVRTSTKSARNGTTTITPEGNEAKTIVDADGKTTVDITYDAAGQPQSATSGGVSTTTTVDTYGRVTATSGANGSTSIGYSGTPMGIIGLPSSVTLPGRGTRNMSYDGRGRATGTNVGAPGERTRVLDALGRPVEIWDQNGKTAIEYDAMSRVKKLTNPRLDVETYTYDDDGNLTDVVRGNGATVHYSVELRGDVTGESDGPYVSLYAFDGEGNVRSHWNGVGQTTNAYDDDGRLKSVTHADGFVETHGYDEDGNRTQMVDRTGTTTWTYSLANRPLTMSSPAGNVSYGYDAYGNARSVAHAAPGVTPTIQTTITTNRVFPSGRVTWYGNGYTNVLANYTYDTSGRLATVTRPGGTSTTYGYDAWGRANSIVHKNVNGGVIRSEAYTYEGTRVKTRTVGSVTTTYTYDAAGQIQAEARPGYSASYTYDRNGNRLSRTVNGTTDTYSYTGDRLDAISRTGGYTKTYSYDAAGRPTQIKGWDNVYRSLNWIDEDNLISAPGILPGAQAYNGDGARVSRNGQPYRRAGASVTSPVLDDGPNRALVPGVGERNGSHNYVLLPDRLGTNTITVEPSGTQVPPAVETDAFGLQWQTPGQRSRWNWKGAHGYYDEDGGAYLIGNRWYDADAGRFLTRDTKGHGRNWWLYSDNDPVNRIDPTGNEYRPYPNDGDVMNNLDDDEFIVVVVGESGYGKPPEAIELRHGERDPDGFDADNVVIISRRTGKVVAVYHLEGSYGGLIPADVQFDYSNNKPRPFVFAGNAVVVHHGDGSQTSHELGLIIPLAQQKRQRKGVKGPRPPRGAGAKIGGTLQNGKKFIEEKWKKIVNLPVIRPR